MRHAELVADRFMRTAHGWIDLATAQPARIRQLTFRCPSARDRWLERSASLWQIRHPHLVQIADYGCLGPTSVFEAVCLPGDTEIWRHRDARTARAVGSAVDFLLRQGLSPGRLAWCRVVKRDGRPALVPDGATGWPLSTEPRRRRQSRGTRGTTIDIERARLARFLRPCSMKGAGWASPQQRRPLYRAGGGSASSRTPRVVGQVIELIESGRPAEMRHVRLSGRRDCCIAALGLIAREARLRGFVPVSAACAAGPELPAAAAGFGDLIRLIEQRHVLLIRWHDEASGPARRAAARLLLDLGIASQRPHIMLTLDASASTSSASTSDGELHLTPAADCCGQSAPELQVARQGSTIVMPRGEPELRVARASESRSDYGASNLPGAPAREGTGVANEPSDTVQTFSAYDAAAVSSAGHLRARNRCVEGLRLTTRGRHSAGARLLREATAALARRGDNGWAGWAALNLGRVLHGRGRSREAAAAFEQARTLLDQSGSSATSICATVYLGLVWTDNARLREAEAALRAAAIAAAEVGSTDVHDFSRLALARCLLWQRRLDEAEALLPLDRHMAGRAAGRPEAPLQSAGAFDARMAERGKCREAAAGWRWREDVDAGVMAACLLSRISVGRRDLAAAGLLAVRAETLARHTAEARNLVAAQAAAARVHAEIADVDGLRRLVRVGLLEAARAHAPLEAIRLRLLLADGLRRGGLVREADHLAARLARAGGDKLPLLLRRRIEAAARGLLSTDVEAPRTGDVPVIRATVAADGAPGQAFHDHKVIVADVVDLLRTCDDVPDEAAIMDRLALHLRQQLRASSVAFFGAESSGLVAVASSGSRPFPIEVASRACEASLDISPSDAADSPEAAVPVRYGGATIGALACRWPVDTRPRSDRLEAVLSTAAALAAPAVRAALDRRACPQAVLAAEPDLMGVSELMSRLRATIARAAVTPFPVLIEGESGTGKELVARAIHRLSPRRERKCHTLNCAALTDDLVEAELFGHARGAFTGAVGERMGLFEDADGGTLMLDEVGELSARAQAKLLRVLQEGEVRRVGENMTRSVDVRVVAAANRPLQDEVAAGRFRRDLFYRLAVIRVAVPPLRDRVDDIPTLANHFWEQAIGRTGSRATLAPATLAALARYNWPGNVRELQNVLTALAVSAPRRGTVGPVGLPAAITTPEAGTCRTTLGEARRAFEIRYVRAALAQAGGRRGRAARELGLSRQGFAKMLARLNVEGGGG